MVKTLKQVGLGILVLIAGLYFWEKIKNSIFGFDNKKSTVITHDVVLEQIETLGKLELVKYKLRDVLEYEVNKKYWFDSKAVLIISGEAVGCIDLRKIKIQDITEKDSSLYIKLPEPELCYVKVNHNESRVYSTTKTGFDEGQIVQDAYKQAEKQIEKVARESNILEQTKQNAELILKPLLSKIAKRKIIFTYDLTNTTIKKK
jgi:hypothetical protein